MTQRLTSRERVRAFFQRQPADRVPVNYICNPGIDRRLKAHFGLSEGDNEGLLRALGVDFRGVGPNYTGPALHAPAAGVDVDPLWGFRSRWVENESGGYQEICEWPLQDATACELEAWPLASPDDFDYAEVAAQCGRCNEFAVFTGNPGICDIINFNGRLRTMEQVLVDLISEDEGFGNFVDRYIDLQVERIRRTLAAANGRIDFLWIGEDLGTQIGPMISLPLFRSAIRSRMQKFVDVAKAFQIPVMIHSCGSSSWAFDDFIEMGIQAVDTLQPEAAAMAPSYLKERFGGRLSFHGMISTAGSLAYGRADEVAANVRETLALMMPGGGYALAPTHQIQDNSPTENVLAMYQAAEEYGGYL
jgi:uroporphyrinogen decarboxylase